KEHTMGRPTLEINGIYGGYQGEGSKTIIPSTATAKITCRLVPDQDPKQIQELLKNHIEKVKPTGVEVDVSLEKQYTKANIEKQTDQAYNINPDHQLIKIASDCYEKAFQKETVFVRMGGSIPVVEWFDALYQKPVILMGFGTPEDRLHSPNESFPIDSFTKGMETLVYYYRAVANNEYA